METLTHISVQAWFEEQVRATPERIAVVFDEKEITYAQLNIRANRLARRLEKLGVGPDTLVAVCLERSFDLIIALLAILKAGGAYLPIDPALPRERQALMLDDAQPLVLISEQELQPELPPVRGTLFIIDQERASLDGESGADQPGRITGKNLAYVIYTSGSTGVPKGVEIPHEALVNFLASMKERPGLNAQDVLVAVTTFSFDIAGLEIFLPLVTGAKLIFLSRDDAADGFRVLHHLTAHQATVLQATPSTWRMLLDAKWPGNPQLKMLCGGEALPRDLATQLLAKGGELWNMYGPTETTIWSSAARITSEDPSISIGQPIANTQLYILDPHLQPVPLGVTGELHIGGLGLARGYRNRAELTAEKFVPDPYSGVPGARLYKTGDVARLRAKGQIELLGRLDHQVKIRGFRIELGEIEARIGEHPMVKEVVVTAREDMPGRKQLVAYLVLRVASPDGMAPADIRAFLEPKLPDYMIPAFFEVLDALPRTPNGKINRKALPAPRTQVAIPNRPYVAPRNATEEKLTQIWAEVLGRDKVGIEDNIFEIGGDSLLIFRIAARATEAGLPVSIRQFFLHRTIAEMLANPGSTKSKSLPQVSAIRAVSRDAYRRPSPPTDNSSTATR